jgi:predicted RNase H-like HicB family nuclease
MSQYIALVRNEDARSCTITFPDFPGVSASTDGLEQVIDAATTALRLHIVDLERRGERVPPPRTLGEIRADANQSLEGAILTFIAFPPPRRPQQHITVALDVDMIDAIDRVSEELGLTRSGFLSRAAAVMLAEHGGVTRVLRPPVSQNPQMEQMELPDGEGRITGAMRAELDPHED